MIKKSKASAFNDKKENCQQHCHIAEAKTPVKKSHPDHTSALARLKKIKGQINGLEEMIQSKRYCVDILIQFSAVYSALKVTEASILKRHIENCLLDAMQSKDKLEIEKKISELTQLISKRF